MGLRAVARAVAACAAALAAADCAAPPRGPGEALLLDGPAVVLPLREEPEGVWTLELLLEGDGPHRFLLDTGSEVLALSPDLAARFRRAEEGLPFRIRGAVDGAPREVPRGTLGEVALVRGGRARDVPYAVVPVPHGCDGIAGLGLFRGHRVTLDFGRGVLEARPDPVRRGRAPLPRLEIAVDGVPVEVLLDTGFAGTLYLPGRTAAALGGIGPSRRSLLLADVHGGTPAEERRVGGAVAVAGRVEREPWILVGEGEPLLGTSWLRGRRLHFDGGGALVALEK
jgi:predicted aspartyl protease